MNLTQAYEQLELGKRVTRKVWNNKNIWLQIVKVYPWGEFEGKKELLEAVSDPKDFLPWIGIKSDNNKFLPWQITPSDIATNDWEVI